MGRAERRIEEGSAYSSDFEEVDQSEYVSTDGGESSPTMEVQKLASIKVLRYDSIKPSPVGTDRAKNVRDSTTADLAKTGDFGEAVAATDQVVVDVIDDETKNVGEGDASPQIKPKEGQELLDNRASVDSSNNLRVSAADKLFNHIRA